MVDELLPVLNNIIYSYFEMWDWSSIRYFRPNMIIEAKTSHFNVDFYHANCEKGCDCPKLPRCVWNPFGYGIEFIWGSRTLCEYDAATEYHSDEKIIHYRFGNVVVKCPSYGLDRSVEIFTSDEKRPEIPDLIPQEFRKFIPWEVEESPNPYPDFRDPAGTIRKKYAQLHKNKSIDLRDLTPEHFIIPPE